MPNSTSRSRSRTTADPRPLDFNKVCKPLAQMVNSTCVPLTCILLQDGDDTYRKTLVGTALSCGQSSTLPSDNACQQSSEGPSHFSGVPRELKNAKDREIDQIGGTTMFAIASLAKPLLALTYCVIIGKQIFENLTWNTRIRSWMRDLYGGSAPISEIDIDEATTIRHVLLNCNALPPNNRFLFLPDGTFQITDEDFFSYIERITHDSTRRGSTRNNDKKLDYQYSNLNTIMMARLLEKKFGRTIDEIMEEHLFKPLGMRYTTLNSESMTAFTQGLTGNVALGQRMSGDLATCVGVSEQRYKGSTAYKMTVGMWSCTDDLAKLYNAICDALPDGRGSYFTKSMIYDFLNYIPVMGDASMQRVGISFAGLVHDLKAPYQGMESLNHVILLQTESDCRPDTASYQPGGSDMPGMYYKGGTCDGFTSTVYFYPSQRKFAIALSNTSGPVDVTEPFARYLLQTAINFGLGYSINSIRDDLDGDMERLLECGPTTWRKLEAEDADFDAWSDDMQPFAGVYQHYTHKLEMEITGNQAMFRRSRQESSEVLTTMRIGASGNKLRLFPGHKGLFVDRLSFWNDLSLTVNNKRGVLSSHGDEEMYVRRR